jgi:hypothetical protein
VASRCTRRRDRRLDEAEEDAAGPPIIPTRAPSSRHSGNRAVAPTGATAESPAQPPRTGFARVSACVAELRARDGAITAREARRALDARSVPPCPPDRRGRRKAEILRPVLSGGAGGEGRLSPRSERDVGSEGRARGRATCESVCTSGADGVRNAGDAATARRLKRAGLCSGVLGFAATSRRRSISTLKALELWRESAARPEVVSATWRASICG